jgi:hypothetical protein
MSISNCVLLINCSWPLMQKHCSDEERYENPSRNLNVNTSV